MSFIIFFTLKINIIKICECNHLDIIIKLWSFSKKTSKFWPYRIHTYDMTMHIRVTNNKITINRYVFYSTYSTYSTYLAYFNFHLPRYNFPQNLLHYLHFLCFTHYIHARSHFNPNWQFQVQETSHKYNEEWLSRRPLLVKIKHWCNKYEKRFNALMMNVTNNNHIRCIFMLNALVFFPFSKTPETIYLGVMSCSSELWPSIGNRLMMNCLCDLHAFTCFFRLIPFQISTN